MMEGGREKGRMVGGWKLCGRITISFHTQPQK